MWSLMWEYAANIAYALVLIKVTRRVLEVLVALAAMLVIYLSYKSGQLSGGWGGRGNFWGGMAASGYCTLLPQACWCTDANGSSGRL